MSYTFEIKLTGPGFDDACCQAWTQACEHHASDQDQEPWKNIMLVFHGFHATDADCVYKFTSYYTPPPTTPEIMAAIQ